MPTAKEGTTNYLTLEFFDRAGAAVAPQTVTYRVDCLTTSTAIRPETGVTPAAQIEIMLNAEDTRIVNESNAIERRVVTVRAVYGIDDQVQDEFLIDIERLSFA